MANKDKKDDVWEHAFDDPDPDDGRPDLRAMAQRLNDSAFLEQFGNSGEQRAWCRSGA